MHLDNLAGATRALVEAATAGGGAPVGGGGPPEDIARTSQSGRVVLRGQAIVILVAYVPQ